MRQKPGAPPNTRCKGCPSEFDPCLWCGTGDKPAHLVVISGSPSGFSIGQKAAFFGPTGRLFDKLLGLMKSSQKDKLKDLKVYKTYAVLAGAVDIKTEHIKTCQPHLLNELASIRGLDGREPVLVTIGPAPLKALGFKNAKMTDVVGRELTTSLPCNGSLRTFKVIPLFDMKTINGMPGYTNVVLSALLRAAQLATGAAVSAAKDEIEELSKNYVYPKTLDEVELLVDHILEYYDTAKGAGPQNWLIALDTETNTRYPEIHPNPKVLMLSVAWDDQRAATILLDHPETPYDRTKAWEHVRKLLRCPKPKVFHHYKFDRKFLERVYGISVNNVSWDTLCGEHYIDEDKKGLYGLKKLTRIYAPSYTGYEDELADALRRGETSEDGVILRSEADVLDEEVAPEGRDQTLWDVLRETITRKQDELHKPKNTKDKVVVKQLKVEITKLYKELDMKHEKAAKKADTDGFEHIPLGTILKYAAIDADATRIITKLQMHRLNAVKLADAARSVMKNIYIPASRALGNMELEGFPVDLQHLDNIERGANELLRETEDKLKSKFGVFNFRSYPQVQALLGQLAFEKIPGADGTSADKEVLNRYIKHYPVGDARRDFAEGLVAFRAADKTKGGFLKKMRQLIGPDNRIHCSFNLTTTATGRTSSSRPNMQNIPPFMCKLTTKDVAGNDILIHPGFNIKKLFKPSSPDNLIVNVDIKGAELRVYTAYSHDEKMLEALLGGLDVHSYTASKIYKIPYEVIELGRATDKDLKKKRDIAKRVVFGTFYGAGSHTISLQINSTKEEAQAIINLLFAEYPALKNYIDATAAKVKSLGYVQSLMGRVRRFKLAHVSSFHMAESIREAVNFLIQSTASDLVVSQLCEIDEHVSDIQGKLLITVHDSITLEIPKSMVTLETRKDENGKPYTVDTQGNLHKFFDKWIVQRVKEKFTWLPVPFLYDLELGPSYGELREVRRVSG